VLDDASVFVSGDQTKSDTYTLKFSGEKGASSSKGQSPFSPDALRGVTAIQLEALPDERLPQHGPGRTYYEGPFGDFYLSEFRVTSAGKAVRLANATHSYAGGKT